MEGTDAGGQPVYVHTPICTRWARVEPITGREVWNAEQVQADVTHRVTVRFDETIQANAVRWSFDYNGRIFEVRSARDIDEARRFLELLCVEQV